MKERNLLSLVLLFIFTLGIYQIYWYIVFQSELKDRTGEGFGGFGHLMMTIFTFGIYYFYWQYAAGKRLSKLGASDYSAIYLILGIFIGGLINPLLMQSQANDLR